MKKAKKKTLIISCVIAVVVIALIFILGMLLPLLKMKARLDELITENYKFSVTCNVRGMDLPVLGDDFSGEIKGSKGDEVLYGEIIYEDKSYLEFYVNADYDMVFDFEPLIQSLFAEVSGKMDKPFLNEVVNYFIKDNYISMEQIEEIVGLDIITISEKKITSDVFKALSGERVDDVKYDVKKIKNVTEEQMLIGDEAVYFNVQIDNADADLIIGIPNSNKDKCFSLEIIADEVTWEFIVDYELMKSAGKSMPDNLISEIKMGVLKTLYSYWLEEKNK